MRVLLSIKHIYVEQILNNTKSFELRRRFTNKEIKEILIYETSPKMKVVALAQVLKVHKDKLDVIWDLTYKKNGVSKKRIW